MPEMLRPTLLLLALIAGIVSPAHAAEDGVSVELNKLEPNGTACRTYLVLENGTESAFKTLKLDLVMFDTDGVGADR